VLRVAKGASLPNLPPEDSTPPDLRRGGAIEGQEEGHRCCSPVGEKRTVRRRSKEEREMGNYLHAAAQRE